MYRLTFTLFSSCLIALTGCGGGSDSNSFFDPGSGSDSGSSSSYDSNVPSRADSYCIHTNIARTGLTANDPLLPQQWYLINTGQNAYSSCAGIAGNDINLPESLWSDVTGSGVNVGILDTEIDSSHPDLTLSGSVDYDGATFVGDHATSVAGIIGAIKNNNKGGSGIAPEASLYGFNILNSDNQYSTWYGALGETGKLSASLDIFNQSFGYGKVAQPQSYDTNMHSFYENGVETLRSGKGALYFKAAGNNYSEYNNVCTGLNTNDFGLPCQNASMDPDNNIPYNMVVAAVNAKGKASSYSSSGSSVIFSAPGGEYGVNNPAIIAPTDLENNSTVDGNDDYTKKFNGTSSASPMAAGVAALILEKKPTLGWRDVRHIMLTTADKIDSSIPAAVLTWNNGQRLTAEPAWQNNGAGHHYHNWYGFGRINAQAAVTAAGSYGSNLPAQQTKTETSPTLNLAIPDNSATGTSYTLTVASGNNLTVESVQVKLEFSHTYVSDLQIQLTSPSGMVSVLMTPRNGMGVAVTNQELVLLSQAFYGEDSLGDWTLEVFDTNGDDTGTLHDWSMTVYGH